MEHRLFLQKQIKNQGENKKPTFFIIKKLKNVKYSEMANAQDP